MRTVLALALVAFCLPAAEARAERGHQAYREMIKREEGRRRKARIDAFYSCKRRGTPLFQIDRSAIGDAPASRLVMYPGGAVELVDGDATLWACVDRRVNGWVRWQLAKLSWRTTGAGTCEAAAESARFSFQGRERFVECEAGAVLVPKARERLVEIEATLLAAARKGP